ncbi:MAG: sporulation transcriptional regulator SpoIIID [Clostridia bacterium]|nr:sporulation transcriptional regulator SpoIIID [Clostridia bacterium]
MKYLPEERAKELALYIIETGATVRQTAKRFGISKSTVHTDITARLIKSEPDLYDRVRLVLDINKEERHIRGGEATRRKFGKRNTECESAAAPSEAKK